LYSFPDRLGTAVGACDKITNHKNTEIVTCAPGVPARIYTEVLRTQVMRDVQGIYDRAARQRNT